MRNLKKVLALVLAMAMSLSLAVTAGAAFNDQDKIVNTEAVDMCSALGIINGYTDGSFKPEGNVTRAEAAKMITIALNGGKEPTLSASATPTYSDIAGHWAAKYIEYCTSLGIVAGDGAGKFNPNGNVKAVELAKMLLIALGYSAEAEKFVGANWDTNVNVVASQKDLYEDLESIDPSVAATRDVAAQMVWNALNILMVDYTYKLSTDGNGNLVSELKVYDLDQTLLQKKFQTLPNAEGQLVKVAYNDKDEEYQYWLNSADGAADFVTETNYIDLLGQDVTFVAKAADKVYGAFANSVVIATGIAADFEKCEDDCMEIAGVEYDMTVGAEAKAQVISIANHVATVGAEVALAGQTAYYEVAAIDSTDDGDIDSFIVSPVNAPADVTYVGSDKVKLNGVDYGTDAEKDEYTVYEGIAKEDVVQVVADKTLKTLGDIVKMDAVSGKVESVTKSDDAVVVAGTTYDYSLSGKTDANMADFLDKTVEFYVVNGYMFKIDGDVATELSEFVILADKTESAGLGGYVDAEIVFTDGTTEVVKAKAAEDSELVIDTLYTFEVENGKYELTNATLTTEEFEVVGNSTIAMTPADKAADTAAKINGYKFADDAVVLVKTEDGYVLKTGADLAKVTDPTATVNYYGANIDDKTNVTTVEFAVVVTEGTSVSDWQYGFVTTAGKIQASADGDYSTLTIWNGAEVALTTDFEVTTEVAKGEVVKYKTNEDGKVTEIAVVAGAAAAVTMIDGENLGFAEIDDEDTIIFYVDKSENAGAAAGSIVLADKDESETPINNVYAFDAESDGVLELLIVDIDNEWK